MGRGRIGYLGWRYDYGVNRSSILGKWNTVSDLSLLPILCPD